MGERSLSTGRRKEEDLRFSSAKSAPLSTPASQKSVLATPLTPSSNVQYVLLHDWWLLKAENGFNGNRLAVSGFTTQGNNVTRVFNSAPIIKRLTATTFETADGITVRIQGFINKARTHYNGIPPEVSCFFSIGFPYNWEHYAAEYFGNEPTSTNIPTSSFGADKQSENSSDGAGSIYPIKLEEFSMAKILEVLASNPDTSIDDVLARNFTHTPRKDGSITGITVVDLLNSPCEGKPSPPLACTGCNNEAWPVAAAFSPNSVNVVDEQLDTTQSRVQEPEKDVVISSLMPKRKQKWPTRPCRWSVRPRKP